MNRTIVAILAFAFLMYGCAGLEITDVSNPKVDEAATGFRYYDTSPFLLMYTDNKGGLKSELLYLPDTTKKRSIKPYGYLAKNDVTLNFVDGRLSQAKAVVDETILPSAIIAGLEKVASAQIKAANAGSEEAPSPYLFRIHKIGGVWKLSGGQAIKYKKAAVVKAPQSEVLAKDIPPESASIRVIAK